MPYLPSFFPSLGPFSIASCSCDRHCGCSPGTKGFQYKDPQTTKYNLIPVVGTLQELNWSQMSIWSITMHYSLQYFRSNYRVTRQLESYILLQSIWGVQKLSTIAAHKPGKLPTLIGTKHRNQGDGSTCKGWPIMSRT